jgi:acetyltransferase-like isoleucine patch superfamily enzyme
LRRIFLNIFFGFEIHPTAKVGFSFLFARKVTIGEHAVIGSLTLARRLKELRLDEYARLGHMNWVSGGHEEGSGFFSHRTDRYPSLVLEKHAAITGHHRIDATDSVRIGAYSTIAGNHTQILTHSIDIVKCRQDCMPVYVGSYCFIGTGCILLPGARIPDYSVVGAGAVVTANSLKEQYMLYGGVPARPLRKLATSAGYFLRNKGVID